MSKIANRLVASAGAATFAQVWRLGVTFATHMALRRFVPPEQFGVWVWAEPLFLILAQVRDLGLPAHVMRSSKRPYGKYFALELGWGGAFSLLIFLGAPLLALAYADHDAETVAMIRAMCLFLFVQGLGSVALTYFEAELQVIRAIPAELARNAVFAVLSLLLAYQGYGAWSMVSAHIVAGVVFTAMLWWKARGRIPLERERGGTLLSPGGDQGGGFKMLAVTLPLMVMAILELMVYRLDAFVLGLRFPTEVVGWAGLATYAAYFFSRHLADPIGRALLPGMVRYRENPELAFGAFRIATFFLTSLMVPTAFFLFVNAELVALFLGGEEWLGATTYLRMISLVPLVRPLAMFGPDYLLTRHEDRLVIWYTTLNLVSLGGLGLLLTTTELGPLGMALASYFPLGILVMAWGVYHANAAGTWRLTRNLFELYAVAAMIFAPILWIPEERGWWRLALSCVAGLAVLGYTAVRFGKDYKKFMREG